MSRLLATADCVKGMTTGGIYLVQRYLAGGTQGEVYVVERDGAQFAVKWYFPHMCTQGQRQILDDLVLAGPPNDSFLWPIEVVTRSDDPGGGFGYVMGLRNPRYQSVVALLKAEVQPTFRCLVTAGLNLVEAFHELHAAGRAYRDINQGGLFIDYGTGDVLICDNDNVYVDGLGDASVRGTMRWMAPEILVGNAKPSAHTDLYSLSVMLFFLFVVHHPLDGANEAAIRSLDDAAMNKIYGHKPVFIFDPEDHSNRPLESCPHHENAIALWPMYPRFFQAVFIKAFTAGLRDPVNGRIRLPDWLKALSQLRDLIYHCGSCGREVFWDPDAFRENQGEPLPCNECGKTCDPPGRIRFEDTGAFVVVEPGTQLHAYHLTPLCTRRVHSPTGVIRQVDDRLMLANHSQSYWTLHASNGSISQLRPGQEAELITGVKINFGQRVGAFRR